MRCYVYSCYSCDSWLQNQRTIRSCCSLGCLTQIHEWLLSVAVWDRALEEKTVTTNRTNNTNELPNGPFVSSLGPSRCRVQEKEGQENEVLRLFVLFV